MRSKKNPNKICIIDRIVVKFFVYAVQMNDHYELKENTKKKRNIISSIDSQQFDLICEFHDAAIEHNP